MSSDKDLGKKIFISLKVAIIFLLISSQFMYNITNKIGLKTLDSKDRPTTWGYTLHTIVFALIVFLSMYIPTPDF
jgi:hypothetical protein